jgi:hypothetical protein
VAEFTAALGNPDVELALVSIRMTILAASGGERVAGGLLF